MERRHEYLRGGVRNGEPLDGRGLIVAQNAAAWRIAEGAHGSALLAWEEVNSGTTSLFVRTLAIDEPPSAPLLIASNAGTSDRLSLAGAASAESDWVLPWTRGASNRLTFLDDAARLAQAPRELPTNARYKLEALELIATANGYLLVSRAIDRFLGGIGATIVSVRPLDRSGNPIGEDALLPQSLADIISVSPAVDGGAAILYASAGSPALALVDASGAVRLTQKAAGATGVFRTSRSLILTMDDRLLLVGSDGALSDPIPLPARGRVAIAPGALVQEEEVNSEELGSTRRVVLHMLNE